MVGTKGTKRLSRATNLPSKIVDEALELYDQIVNKNKMVRRLGYDFSDLMDESLEQVDFFANIEDEKKEKQRINMVLDIKDRYGKNAILRGIDFDERATQRERNEQVGGHKGGES